MLPTLPVEPSFATETAVLAAFEQRLLTRDEPIIPAPLPCDAESVQQRLRRALRLHLKQRDPRRLRTLALICYRFLAAPVQLSTAPALVEALGILPGALTQNWRELRESGLVDMLSVGRQRQYRLSRMGEDWLLAVVKGAAA